MEDLFSLGQAQWPLVTLERGAFEARAAAQLASAAHAADFYLAHACALGDPAALAAFDEHFLSRVPTFLARLNPGATLIEEVKQLLRVDLLLAAPDKPPRIGDYSGRGSLSGWVRVIAVRFLHRQRRRLGDRALSDDVMVAQLVGGEPSPEVQLLKARHGRELAAAIKLAVVALPASERLLLKQHVIEGLTIDDLAGFYQVHRATVARRLVRLKEQLFDEATAALKRQLALDSAELDSLCRAVRSQLDLSLEGVL